MIDIEFPLWSKFVVLAIVLVFIWGNWGFLKFGWQLLRHGRRK